MEFDDLADCGLDPNREDYEEWLNSPEGRAVTEEMHSNGDDIDTDMLANKGEEDDGY